MEKQAIGKIISPMLENYETILWDWEAREMGKPYFTKAGYRAAIKLFMCATMDKMNDLQQADGMSQKDAEAMAETCGKELHRFIKNYTGIDCKELWQ